MREYVIDKGQAGQRLDKYLMRILPGAPYSLVRKLLRKKTVRLNGRHPEGSELLQENDAVRVFLSDERIEELSRGEDTGSWTSFREECGRALREIGDCPVVYEDEDVLIVDKPFGALSQKGSDRDISMNEWLIARLWQQAGGDSEEGRKFYESLQSFRPSVCNRLDRNTGGLLLCGKTLRGSRMLTALLRSRTLKKYYLAVAMGEFSGEGILRDRLQRDMQRHRVEIGGTEGTGSEACTRYHVLRSGGGRTLVEAELVTGKTHQIRAQFAAFGHPLLGDLKYGGPRSAAGPADRRLAGPGHTGRDSLPGQYLYCYRLVFPETDDDGTEVPEGLRGREVRTDPPTAFQRAMAGGGQRRPGGRSGGRKGNGWVHGRPEA